MNQVTQPTPRPTWQAIFEAHCGQTDKLAAYPLADEQFKAEAAAWLTQQADADVEALVAELIAQHGRVKGSKVAGWDEMPNISDRDFPWKPLVRRVKHIQRKRDFLARYADHTILDADLLYAVTIRATTYAHARKPWHWELVRDCYVAASGLADSPEEAGQAAEAAYQEEKARQAGITDPAGGLA